MPQEPQRLNWASRSPEDRHRGCMVAGYYWVLRGQLSCGGAKGIPTRSHIFDIFLRTYRA